MGFRQNDYRYINKPAPNKYLENFPCKQILSNWNSLDIDIKSTSDADTFKHILKETYLPFYNCDNQ